MSILREFDGEGYHAVLVELPEKETLRLTVTGSYHLGSDPELLRTTNQLASQRDYHQCLVDYQNAKVYMSTIDIVQRPKELDDAGMPRQFKSALLFNSANSDLDVRFLENYFYNRGYRIRCFFDYEEALSWLQA